MQARAHGKQREIILTPLERRRRIEGANHSAKLPGNGPRLRQGSGFCFTGGLCDAASMSPEYRGSWQRMTNGMWTFLDAGGKPHDAHMPLDLQKYYGMKPAEAAALIAAQEDGATKEKLARQFIDDDEIRRNSRAGEW